MITPNFNCSQSDLVVVLQTALNSFFQYLKDFTDFSPTYTNEWGNSKQSELAAAAAMMDEETSRAISEEIRKALVKNNKLGCLNWQVMKRYIIRSFDEDLVTLKQKAAGGNYYEKASNEGWPQAQQMFTNALNFIEANKAKLSAVMPEKFPGSFTEVVSVFKQSLSDYEQSKEAITENTQGRLKALNKINKEVSEMMQDGQYIFKTNEAVRKQFVFSDVLGRVSGAGLAGIRGAVTEATTNIAIANANITVSDGTGKTIGSATSDAEGKFVINTPSGTFTVTVVANGYIARSVEGFTVDVGTVSKLDVALSPVVVEE